MAEVLGKGVKEKQLTEDSERIEKKEKRETENPNLQRETHEGTSETGENTSTVREVQEGQWETPEIPEANQQSWVTQHRKEAGVPLQPVQPMKTLFLIDFCKIAKNLNLA